MAKRIRNRMELREQFEAAERRETEGEEATEETEEAEDDDDEEEEEEAEGEPKDDAASDEEPGDEDDEDEPAPKKKKKKPAPKAPPKTKPRTRAAKVVRKRVVWGVFNNSNQMVSKYDYPKKKDAHDHATKLTEDKKQGHPFFVQPVKEDIVEEKKE